MKPILFLILVVSINSFGSSLGFDQCKWLFPNNKVPSSVENSETRELCFTTFAVLYSVKTKTPVYAVEKINQSQAKFKEKRSTKFHEEPLLKTWERSTLEDYARSGYDRGHNYCAEDVNVSYNRTPQNSKMAMYETFSLANMMPQTKRNNEIIWAKNVEGATRKYLKRLCSFGQCSDLYVFTGPYFSQDHKTIGKNKIWVPDYIWKLVYDPSKNRSWVFWIENTETCSMHPPISYDEFVKRTGFNLLNK